jgi:hypothetical protein
MGQTLASLSAAGVDLKGALHTFDLPATVGYRITHQQPADVRFGFLAQKTGQQRPRLAKSTGLKSCSGLL